MSALYEFLDIRFLELGSGQFFPDVAVKLALEILFRAEYHVGVIVDYNLVGGPSDRVMVLHQTNRLLHIFQTQKHALLLTDQKGESIRGVRVLSDVGLG